MKFRVVEYWLDQDGEDLFPDEARIVWTGSCRRSAERIARKQASKVAYTGFVYQVQEVVVHVTVTEAVANFYPMNTFYGVRSAVGV